MISKKYRIYAIIIVILSFITILFCCIYKSYKPEKQEHFKTYDYDKCLNDFGAALNEMSNIPNNSESIDYKTEYLNIYNMDNSIIDKKNKMTEILKKTKENKDKISKFMNLFLKSENCKTDCKNTKTYNGIEYCADGDLSNPVEEVVKKKENTQKKEKPKKTGYRYRYRYKSI
jgi:hypothetical protein